MALAKIGLLRVALLTVAVSLPLGSAMAGPFSIFKRDKVEEQPSVQMVQATDPRVAQLEEQVRRLNGTVEDLNFQILQLQEQIRKQLEDMQFRLDQMEGNSPAQGDGQSGALETEAPAKAEAAPAAPTTLSPAEEARAELGDEVPMDAVEHSPRDVSVDGSSAELGAQPRDLGNLTLDDMGNIRASLNDPGQTDDTMVASLPAEGATPSAIYSEAYQRVLAGDYASAESGFRRFGEQYPDDPQAADAQFWLGESLRGQERYADAVEVFLDGTKTHADSDKAPDMMLKLGVTLAAMGQRDVACETLHAIPDRYPDMSDAFRLRLKQEEASASC
ncbi:tol-pal system protein YbgF [Notoacmeibacter marinus]|nr:tol-pal system protein YbgF [Notoacmeibacter marinus]